MFKTIQFAALLLFAIASRSLSAEIYEIRLTIDKLVCPYCAKVLVDHLKQVHGIRGIKVWTLEGMGLVEWGKSTPFRLIDLSNAFEKTQFVLDEVEIDVEGVIEEKSGALILHSLPENSFFYIDNPTNPAVSHLQANDTIRLKGILSTRRDRNVLFVTAVFPPV